MSEKVESQAAPSREFVVGEDTSEVGSVVDEPLLGVDYGTFEGKETPSKRKERSHAVGSWYSTYVLGVIFLVYTMNQVDRLVLAVVPDYVKEDLHFGNTLYGLVAGIGFTIFYTVAGIPIGRWADVSNRKNLLTAGLVIWSGCTVLSALVKEFWHLLLARIGLALGQAAMTPPALSILADYFTPEQRGTVFSVYNWGIYVGGGLAFGVGGWINRRYGWRKCFWVFGLPGLLLSIILFLTVREPVRGISEKEEKQAPTKRPPFLSTLQYVMRIQTFIWVCIAGSIRNMAGYSLGYYQASFYKNVHHLNSEDYGVFLTFIVPIGGALGSFLGGYVSDKWSKRDDRARAFVCMLGQILAVPFIVGTLLWSRYELSFAFLFPAYVAAEVWLGPALTIVQSLVPSSLRGTSVAVYLFIISNIGGCGPFIVGAIDSAWNLRGALLIMVPGLYVVSALLFYITGLVSRKDLEAKRERESKELLEETRTN